MKQFVRHNKYLLLLLFLFFISELIVNPIGEFPLNDDWAYSKAVRILLLEGEFTIGSWGAMTLFTHIIWGFLFTKIFGFSFMILRISTFVSSLIGLFTLYKLVYAISKKQLVAFIACLTLLFNPLYFNLSNTYMTDVNFNTCLLLVIYFAYTFFQTFKLQHFVSVFILSTLLVLIRQFGIIVPVCFTFACLFLTDKKWKFFIFACIGTLITYFIFKQYESYLERILPKYSAYKFSSSFDLLSSKFWEVFGFYLGIRYKTLLINVLVYTAPFLVFYIKDLFITNKLKIIFPILLTSIFLSSVPFSEVNMLIGNILMNISLGPETFHDNLTGSTTSMQSILFADVINGVKYVFSSISIFVILQSLAQVSFNTQSFTRLKPEVLLLVGILIAYLFLLLVAESYFDRYFIPIISIVIILFILTNPEKKIGLWFACIPILLCIYTSVLGTKDYFTINRIRWDIIHGLKNEKNIRVGNVNGGFEVNCWNDGANNWWYDTYTLNGFDYLIQRKPELGFKLYKELEFQRYFPYKKDKINIFVRDSIN